LRAKFYNADYKPIRALMQPDHLTVLKSFRLAESSKPRTGLVTLLFTDMVGSTALKQQLSDQGGAALFRNHHQLVRDLLGRFPTGQEIETAGDSFLIVFSTPSDAVRFGLLLQAKLRHLREEAGVSLFDRIRIHGVEVVVQGDQSGAKPRELYGIQIDTCSRAMSLAKAGQTLMTRAVFDSSRQVLKGEDIEGVGQLGWFNHGLYLPKGLDEPVEILIAGICFSSRTDDGWLGVARQEDL
jgi:class 3 adenylate cyclase